MTDIVFSVQDDTGTVYQLTALPSPGFVISVNDHGTFSGIPDNGTDGKQIPASVDEPFIVSQVLDSNHFSITSVPDTLGSGWPRAGTITWTSGANTGLTTEIAEIDPANAYADVTFVKKYLASRGRDTGTMTDSVLQTMIVQASDYIDQRYSFRGVKLVQRQGNNYMGAAQGVFIQPWLTPNPWAIVGSNLLIASTTPQETQWPRQGCVDNNGDTVNGIPEALRRAVAELVYRVITGTALQPDYDPNIVTAGGVIASATDKVGPIERVRTYDTKLGLGFFPKIPQVSRILANAGLLVAGGGSRIVH